MRAFELSGPLNHPLTFNKKFNFFCRFDCNTTGYLSLLLKRGGDLSLRKKTELGLGIKVHNK